ncbi:MAG: hypothetical protein WD187_00715 [Candidatus Woykebacteria bacterium]
MLEKLKSHSFRQDIYLFLTFILFASIVITVDSLSTLRNTQTQATHTIETLLFDDFNSSSLNTTLWGSAVTRSNSHVQISNGTVRIKVDNLPDTYAQLYSKKSFPVGSTFETRINVTGGQSYDHKTIGFSNSRAGSDCSNGETEAVVWRGGDKDKRVLAESGGSVTCPIIQSSYPAGWRTIKIVRVSSSEARIYEDGVLLKTFNSNIPTGNLPVRISGYTHETSWPSTEIWMYVDWVKVTKPKAHSTAPPPSLPKSSKGTSSGGSSPPAAQPSPTDATKTSSSKNILNSLNLKISIPYLLGKINLPIKFSKVSKSLEVLPGRVEYSVNVRGDEILLGKVYTLTVGGGKVLSKKVRFNAKAPKMKVNVGSLILGDVNSDSVINNGDDDLFVDFLVGQSVDGDVNADGATNSLDWAIILKNFDKIGDR